MGLQLGPYVYARKLGPYHIRADNCHDLIYLIQYYSIPFEHMIKIL